MRLDPFWLDVATVTNAAFAALVEATARGTVAERLGTSSVFGGLLGARLRSAPAVSATPWWRDAPGTHRRNPEGPGSDIADRMNHSVVHVTWRDGRA
ncbi:SUMF1/EgtB/PvdO family nonheme iron enzyme [Streptomyces sp. LN549]|uniref:SUMF1/EgtB/PvdO family nonheme iron enzyme n=1 Tax=Streptomyces sp. LN549 TaxID=3112979 RepID=UPI00371D7E3F